MCLYTKDHPFICPLLHSFVTYEERCYVLPFAAGGSLRNCMRNYHDTQIDEDDDDIIYRVRRIPSILTLSISRPKNFSFTFMLSINLRKLVPLLSIGVS